jgi:hypothetical protein
MDDLPLQQEPHLSLPIKRRRNVAFIVVVLVFCVVGIVALVKGKSVKTNTNEAAAVPFRTGEVVVINYGTGKFDTTGAALIAVDLESAGAFVVSGQTGSTVLDTLMARNKIYTVLNGTKARILESRPSVSQVRIMDGDSQGKDGWVNNVFLYE